MTESDTDTLTTCSSYKLAHLRWASKSEIAFDGLLFFCWYFAYEYHTPPAVLITNPVMFKACTSTPPSKKKPRVWSGRKQYSFSITKTPILKSYKYNKTIRKENLFENVPWNQHLWGHQQWLWWEPSWLWYIRTW